MKNLDKKILYDLFKASEGLYIFTLYQRFNISPKELFISIKYLKLENLIFEKDDRILLTKDGENYVITNNISSRKKLNKFDQIPLEFIGLKIGINEFYVPNYETFKKIYLSFLNKGGMDETSTKEV